MTFGVFRELEVASDKSSKNAKAPIILVHVHTPFRVLTSLEVG